MTNEETIKWLELYRDGIPEDEMPPHSFDLKNEIVNRCIAALRNQQGWIPCSERMPKGPQTCIVTGRQKYAFEKEWDYFVDVADSEQSYIDGYWNTFNDWVEGQETHIIAWQPLPEPYRGGE